ncbi:ATP synthase F0 subunit B [Desulfovibrio intestinalis]|uniref:ATP synthase subunit b n=1 Tax=Desulfovibrio intestinalis TaxID=58621 RepID=A0A7W8C308_9BACT|nr:ATP synthase F0 subunit B [Desulfovibrio intestinalis]MBB5143502.1 F-type H+-transporting ATPase subunit b [Desulfovibrio intestinalis]
MSKWKHAGYILPLVIAFAAIVFIPLEALASEGHAETRWGDFGWRVLNFVIFAGILWYFVGGLAKRFFKNRRETISGALDDLDERRAKAKEQLAAVESRIARLNEEREAILAESRKQAENLKAGIVDEAHRQASQIVEQARMTAENEGRAVLAEVRAVIADEIVDAAEKALSGKLNAEAHDKLIANSLKKVVLH